MDMETFDAAKEEKMDKEEVKCYKRYIRGKFLLVVFGMFLCGCLCTYMGGKILQADSSIIREWKAGIGGLCGIAGGIVYLCRQLRKD